MIRDVLELRERGHVCRRVTELDVDVETWRAGMRRAARREGMRIRTFLVPSAPLPVTDEAGAPLPDPVRLVYAVRTDLPVDRAELGSTVEALAALLDEPGGSRPI